MAIFIRDAQSNHNSRRLKNTRRLKKKSGKQRDKECFPEAVQEKLHGVTARTQMIKVSKYSQVSALSL